MPPAIRIRRPEALVQRVKTKTDGLNAIAKLGLLHSPKRVFPANQRRSIIAFATQLFGQGKAPNGFNIRAVPSGGNYLFKKPHQFQRVFEVPRKVWVPLNRVSQALSELYPRAKERSDKSKQVEFVVFPSPPRKINSFTALVTETEVILRFEGGAAPRTGEKTNPNQKSQTFVYQIRGADLVPTGSAPKGAYKKLVPQLLQGLERTGLRANTVMEGFGVKDKLFFHEVYPVQAPPQELLQRLRAFDSERYHREFSRYYKREGD